MRPTSNTRVIPRVERESPLTHVLKGLYYGSLAGVAFPTVCDMVNLRRLGRRGANNVQQSTSPLFSLEGLALVCILPRRA